MRSLKRQKGKHKTHPHGTVDLCRNLLGHNTSKTWTPTAPGTSEKTKNSGPGKIGERDRHVSGYEGEAGVRRTGEWEKMTIVYQKPVARRQKNKTPREGPAVWDWELPRPDPEERGTVKEGMGGDKRDDAVVSASATD